MAQTDQIQFLDEFMNGDTPGAHHILGIISMVHTGALTEGEASTMLDEAGYSASAKVGIKDLYDGLIGGTLSRDRVETGLLLAEKKYSNFSTPVEVRSRILA